MRVSEIMSRELVTITPDKRVGQASQLMQKQKICHLPVTGKGRMVGWITSRDLREVLLGLHAGKDHRGGRHDQGAHECRCGGH